MDPLFWLQSPSEVSKAGRRSWRPWARDVVLRIPMGWTPPNGIAMCQGSGVETRYNKEASMDKVSIVGIDIAKTRSTRMAQEPMAQLFFAKRLRGTRC